LLLTAEMDSDVLPARCCLPVPTHSPSDSCWR